MFVFWKNPRIPKSLFEIIWPCKKLEFSVNCLQCRNCPTKCKNWCSHFAKEESTLKVFFCDVIKINQDFEILIQISIFINVYSMTYTRKKIWQSSIQYAGLLIDQASDIPSIIFFKISCKILCKNSLNLFFITLWKNK